MERRRRWRRPWRRPTRRRWVQRLEPSAVDCRTRRDVHMDPAAHRHNRTAAELARRRRVHRSGRLLSAPPPHRRHPSPAADRIGSRANDQRTTDFGGRRCCRGDRTPSRRSGVGTAGVGRRPLRRGAGPVPIAGRRGTGDLGGMRDGRALARRSVSARPRTPGGRARSRTFTVRACSCSPCSRDRWWPGRTVGGAIARTVEPSPQRHRPGRPSTGAGQ